MCFGIRNCLCIYIIMLNLKKINSIYFVGIGGISMSALSKLMKSEGKNVCGCDDKLSIITQKLEKFNIKVFQSFDENAIKNCDLVVYTAAINENNKNLLLAKKLNKKVVERAEFLGEICNQYKTVIAVCGTHGKTTTTAMLAHILKDKNPTVHIGGIMADCNDNLLVGGKEIFITEACEFNKSFLHITPTHTILTNIEPDHMDCYKNFNELQKTFCTFLQKTSKNIVFNNKFLKICNKNFANKNLLTYSQNKNAAYYANNIKEKNGCYSFDFCSQNKTLARMNLNVVGKHNIENAMAASLLCLTLNLPPKEIAKKLETFQNVKRRFEILYKQEIMVISDYAHHPTEITASLKATQKLHKRIVCIFEPHTYSRTQALFEGFLKAFNIAQKTIILKTYAARENENMGKSGYDLFLGLKNKKIDVAYCDNKQELFEKLDKIKENNDILLFLGAGTIDGFARKYVKKLKEQSF